MLSLRVVFISLALVVVGVSAQQEVIEETCPINEPENGDACAYP
jgi:hypothetical protein